MVLVIAFLTITNIALGYGLAIYVNRHYGTLLLSRASSSAALQQKVADHPSVVQLTEELPTLAPTNVSAILDQASAKTAACGQVDEENLLAGIEEFRSQLAKMNTMAEQSAEEAPARAAPPLEVVVAAVGN